MTSIYIMPFLTTMPPVSECQHLDNPPHHQQCQHLNNDIFGTNTIENKDTILHTLHITLVDPVPPPTLGSGD